MKTMITFLLVSLSVVAGSAQTNRRDSLRQLLQKEKTDTGRVLLLADLGFEYLQSKPDTIMVLALEGLSLSRRISFAKGEAVSLNRIGNAFTNLGNYPKAMEAILQALKINEKINNLDGIRRNFNNIGTIYLEQGDYKLALDYLFKAKALAEKINDKIGLSISLVQIGKAYMNLKKIDSAKLFTQQAYDVAYRTHYSRIIGTSLNLMGNIHSETGQNKLALEYYRLSVPYSEKAEIFPDISGAYLGIAKLFEKTKQNDSVLSHASKSLIIAKQKGFTLQVRDAARFLSYYYRKFNADSAFFYQDISKAANDSLFSQEKTKQIQSIAFDEQLRQKDLESERIRYQNQIRLYILLSAVIVFLIIAIFLFRNNKQKQKVNAVLKQQKEKTEKAYEQLKATQAKLVQQEKMASLGELTAGIAHEIQNPLNFVNNFSEVNKELLGELETEINSGNFDEVKAIALDLKENESKIYEHGRRADAIVKGMLQHSRASSGTKEATDINALADEYLRLSYHGLRAKEKSFNATFKTDFDESIGKLDLVPQEIGRVLLNLFNNAFYAVAEKKKQNPEGYNPVVSVTTKAVTPATGVPLVRVCVKDNGQGIPKQVLDKIYQPFFTTKPAGQGTGLGLSLSYEIIKAHGGELRLETKEGEFAEFIIDLPVLPADKR